MHIAPRSLAFWEAAAWSLAVSTVTEQKYIICYNNMCRCQFGGEGSGKLDFPDWYRLKALAEWNPKIDPTPLNSRAAELLESYVCLSWSLATDRIMVHWDAATW